MSPTLNMEEDDAGVSTPKYGYGRENKNNDLLTADAKALKREQILKRGSIPEFIQVTEMYQIYSAFVQVNLKNRLLLENSAAAHQQTLTDSVDLVNIKDDIILI